jgi:hypothetical protein
MLNSPEIKVNLETNSKFTSKESLIMEIINLTRGSVEGMIESDARNIINNLMGQIDGVDIKMINNNSLNINVTKELYSEIDNLEEKFPEYFLS